MSEKEDKGFIPGASSSVPSSPVEATRYTPGPWTVDRGDGVLDGKAKFPTQARVLVFAEGDCEDHPVADCSCNHTCRTSDECAANARLIAATPDLLEALDWLVACVNATDDDAEDRLGLAMVAARTTIQRALLDDEQ